MAPLFILEPKESTMANLSIKDVPEAWTEALRQRAARNHRSLQGELMAVIESSLANPQGASVAQAPGKESEARGLPAQVKPRGFVVGYDRFGHPITQNGWKTVEEVVATIRAKFPEPVTGVDLGVDIIRAERDAR
jgi:plasmid stability protein